MLFSLEHDYGDQVVFYIVPNAFSAKPKARITANGADVLVLEANETRHALVAAGRHETGECGFRIDATLLPNLQHYTDLAIFECETDVLIYRRRDPGNIAKRVLRIETSYMAMSEFDKALMDKFQYSVRRIEKLGHETVTQLFHFTTLESVYLSGRILYKNYAYFIDGQFEIIILLSDPYFILAEQLLVLSRLHKRGKMNLLSERDALLLAPAGAFAAELDMSDGRKLRRALRSMSKEEALAFVNPVTRCLTMSSPDEMPRRGSLASAFDALASFAVVGIRNEVHQFCDTVGALLGLQAKDIRVPARQSSIEELAKLLRAEANVEELIDHDIEIYNQILQAHKTL